MYSNGDSIKLKNVIWRNCSSNMGYHRERDIPLRNAIITTKYFIANRVRETGRRFEKPITMSLIIEAGPFVFQTIVIDRSR